MARVQMPRRPARTGRVRAQINGSDQLASCLLRLRLDLLGEQLLYAFELCNDGRLQHVGRLVGGCQLVQEVDHVLGGAPLNLHKPQRRGS